MSEKMKNMHVPEEIDFQGTAKKEVFMEANKKRSVISWLLEFAADKKIYYVFSVLFAIAGVLCSLVPYGALGRIIAFLIRGNRDWQVFRPLLLLAGAAWIIRVLLHAVSTSLSHVATFQVLADMRRRVCSKLASLPLGTVKDMPSGDSRIFWLKELTV